MGVSVQRAPSQPGLSRGATAALTRLSEEEDYGERALLPTQERSQPHRNSMTFAKGTVEQTKKPQTTPSTRQAPGSCSPW